MFIKGPQHDPQSAMLQGPLHLRELLLDPSRLDRRVITKLILKALSEGTKEPDNAGGLDLIRWPRRVAARLLEPRLESTLGNLSFRRPKRFWQRSFMLGLARWRR